LHIGKIARKHDVKVHLYADDTQLYLAFYPDEGAAAVDQMMDCLEEIRNWMEANMLKLNDSKTEFMVIASSHIESKLSDAIKSIKVGDSVVDAVGSARNIGAVIDTRLNLQDHVSGITRSCYFNLRNIGKIRRNLTHDATVTLVQALVISKLDSLNALLYGVPEELTRKLQLVQNQAARVIHRLRRHDHITSVLKDLHWLPVSIRIKFKINLLTYKCLQGSAPSYLCDLLEEYNPSRTLRSSSMRLLKEKATRKTNKTYGHRAFSICAPKLWNSLPQELRFKDTVGAFKKSLKTYYFKLAYGD
jgi:dsDNA-binding SOS-regulon protein